jgi:NAD(P)-dependent dehydrogenase (short-subunit alcohol dehydrogenase family)
VNRAILSSGRNALRRGLVGRKVLITGAARGIGERVARLVVARGARVALVGLEPDRLRALADDLGPAGPNRCDQIASGRPRYAIAATSKSTASRSH